MVNLTNNFKFGIYNGEYGKIGICHLGICIEGEKSMVVYDHETEELTDVDVFNVQNNNMFMMIPVSINKVEVGDIIVNDSKLSIVTKISTNKKNNSVRFEVINPDGYQNTVVPVKNLFGFDFITKIVSLMGDFLKNTDASEDDPFGSMLPFILMSGDNNNDMMSNILMMNMLNKDEDNNGIFGDIDPVMLMLMMNQNGGRGGSNDNGFFTMMLMSKMLKKKKVKKEEASEE